METETTSTVATRTTHFINGEWSKPGGKTFADYNPFNGEVVAEIAAGGRSEAVAVAVAADAAADAAFPAWAAMTPGVRQRIFLKAADVIERRTKDIVSIMAAETGSGAAFAMFQIKWSIDLMRQTANWGYLPVGDVLRSDVPGRFAMAVRKPLGVVAGFTPWNGAFSLAWRTVALPLAFGNTVVLKPSELAPISAGLILAEILEEAGFPAGVLNVVTHAPGEAGEIADVFFESPAVRSINFTGSAKTARMLAERAGGALKRIVLELAGYNPLIILADADLAHAVELAAFSAFFHQGQICMNARKILIERPIVDEFVERLTAKVLTLKSGDPSTPGVVIGPLITDAALQSVEDRVKEAVSLGAKIVIGGRANGRVYEPTILTNVPPEAGVSSEETFGPVVVIEAVDDAEHALKLAQATPYGLCASIMTADQDRGLDLAQRFNCGMVHVNGATMASEPSLPNGGVKDSGWGRSSHYSVEDFTEIRLTTLTRGAGRYPI
jgi:acyl-CoA reductase-like NAD-dependent aldehyde dehydrogenase